MTIVERKAEQVPKANLEESPDLDLDVSELRAAQLYQSYSAEIFGYLMNLLCNRSSAEDALQETFMKVLRQSEQKLSTLVNPRAWLFKICRRVALDLIRHEGRRRNREVSLDLTRSSATLLALISPDQSWQALASKERQQLLWQVLSTLPMEQRDVLMLKAQGLSSRELGESLECSHTAAQHRLAEALKALTRGLKKYKIFSREDL